MLADLLLVGGIKHAHRKLVQGFDVFAGQSRRLECALIRPVECAGTV